MKEKETVARLRIILPHWLEHNHNHESEFKKWAEEVRAAGLGEVATLLDQAIGRMVETDIILQKILAKVGGPGAAGHHHHD